MQRLHEEDLAGWLLGDRKDGVPVAGGNGEVWEHICLSAVQDDGSALWPAKHNIQKLTLMEKAAPYVFAGQYRQRPAPPAGGFFKPDEIEIVDALPAGILKKTRAWDLASSEGEGAYTAGVGMASASDGYTYIFGVEREQLGPENVNKRIKSTADLDGTAVTIRLPQDPGQAGKSQVKSFTKLLAGYNVVALPVSGDKVTRAQPFAAQVNVGNVRMLRGDWNKDFKDELRNFPNGKYKDQVDAAADAFNDLYEGFTPFFPQMGFAPTGGHITGKGTGTSDDIPIMASNGEFMMRYAAVQKLGLPMMEYINKTGELPFQREYEALKMQFLLPSKSESIAMLKDDGLVGVSRMSNSDVERRQYESIQQRNSSSSQPIVNIYNSVSDKVEASAQWDGKELTVIIEDLKKQNRAETKAIVDDRFRKAKMQGGELYGLKR